MKSSKPSLVLIVLALIAGTAYGQSSRMGFSLQPELNMVLQNPNSFIVENIAPKFGFSALVMVESNMNENWSLRFGLGFNQSRFGINTPFIFEDDIDPTLGAPLSKITLFDHYLYHLDLFSANQNPLLDWF
jgi:hypothetical protein